MAHDKSREWEGNDETHSSRSQLKPVHSDRETPKYSVYECQDCGNVVLVMGSSGVEVTCNGDELDEITDWEMNVESPDLRQVLLDAFGLSKSGLDICLCVIEEGPLSVAELADTLDYGKTTISRYLNDLVEIGLLKKSQLNRQEGGYVNVYHPIDLETMRREMLVGFYMWAGEATALMDALVETATATNQNGRDVNDPGGLQEVFWEDFRGEQTG